MQPIEVFDPQTCSRDLDLNQYKQYFERISENIGTGGISLSLPFNFKST